MEKALYGLKQAPRTWNKRIDTFLIQLNSTRCTPEHGVYVKHSNDDNIIMCLYINVLLVTGTNENEMIKFKKCMMREFEMLILGGYPIS